MPDCVRTTRREVLGIALPAWGLQHAWSQTAPALHIEPIEDKLFLVAGAGGNIAILEGPESLLLVDSGLPQSAEAMEKQVRTGRPPVAVLINTHYHFDHVGGNERFGRAGARIIAHENVARRLGAVQRAANGRETQPLPPEARPKTTFTDSGSLTHGGQKVVYQHVPPAHTDGDTTVRFDGLNVIHMGDLLFNRRYPFIDYAAGGSIEAMSAAAERIAGSLDSKTKVIPGHGPLATPSDLRDFASMLTDIDDRLSKLIREGKTLEQVMAAEPTRAYDEKCGKPASFLRQVYLGKTAAAK